MRKHTHSIPMVGRVLLLVFAVVACVLVLRWQDAGAQGGDDHGNTLSTATTISLGSSVSGRMESGDDVDVFRLTVPGATDVWVYTTGDLNTEGGLFNSSGQLLIANDDSEILHRWYNFSIRVALRGVYYVGVYSRDRVTAGDYTLHVKSVADPGSTLATAKRLSLDAPVGGLIGSATDSDYFRLDLTETKHLYLYARSVYRQLLAGREVNSQNLYVGRNVYVAPPKYPYENGFLIRDEFKPGTHYIHVFTYGDDTRPVPYHIHAVEDVWYTKNLQICTDATRRLNSPSVQDTLYGCQWHLNNPRGQDINVDGVWADGITGQGVNIAVVDDGMYFWHEDLRQNVHTALNHDYTGTGSIFHPLEHHGTKVAGIIAARDNGIGVRGVAPRATIYGYNLLLDSTDENKLDALTRNREMTAVSNNSWGRRNRYGPGLSPASQFWSAALQVGVTSGYNGKGTFYVFSAGNGHKDGYHANLPENINHHAVTVVCGVNESDVRASYSQVGSNLWVCAPTGEDDGSGVNRNIVTTENHDRYVFDFDGTSAAAPIVSGVAALMRQANPDLTWRDLKLILAATARKNDPTNAYWVTGARKYRAEQDTDTYHYNDQYGFGVVDGGAAVALARDWQTLPPMLTSTVDSGLLNRPVPDAPQTGTPSVVDHQVTLDTDVEFTEFVELNITLNHPSFRDLGIMLSSPSGGGSVLALPWNTRTPDDPDDIDLFPLNGSFRLGSARHLGEDPNGTWTLFLTDRFHGQAGVLESWSLTVYGHAPPPPQVEVNFAQSAYSVTEGDSVSVAVSLNADPQRMVTIPVVVTNQGGVTTADYSGVPESVTFTNGGPTLQTFSFTATDDQVADANESVRLGFGPLPDRVSAGNTAETTLAITDNDIAGVTVDPTSLTLTEGATSTYTVKLDTQPLEAVTVAVSSTGNPDVTVNPTTLSFDSLTWSTPQIVTVTAAHDADEQNESATVTHTVNRYGSVTTADSVTVTVTDDDGIPTVQMSLKETPRVRLRTAVPVAVTFSASVSGFGLDDVTVTNGHPENLVAAPDGAAYSFDVVPSAIGTVTVDIPAGAARNAQGQDSVAAPQLLVGHPYDDDHDGCLQLSEARTAIGDYFGPPLGEALSLEDARKVIGLYFSCLTQSQ